MNNNNAKSTQRQRDGNAFVEILLPVSFVAAASIGLDMLGFKGGPILIGGGAASEQVAPEPEVSAKEEIAHSRYDGLQPRP
jgi:hypothetical protein